jgi:hypothetical protein
MNAGEFGVALQLLDPDRDDFGASVDGLIVRLDTSDVHGCIDRVFEFFEAHPVADLGVPGSLVHFVEQFYPEYKARLLFSLRKTPSLSGVWMANRILNAELGNSDRARFLASLEGVVLDPAEDAGVRAFAKRFAGLRQGKI